MKNHFAGPLGRLITAAVCFSLIEPTQLWAQASPSIMVASAPEENPAPPPVEAPQRSQSDLEKLAAPIALYPDQLLATVLPAAAYPLEVVQAARFVKDTNNLAKLDQQPWDDNVKAVARFPEVIKQMDENLAWTSDLGDAFINQPEELMNAIQTMRGKAKDSGALKTTEQQVVTVTNTVVTNMVESQVVYVTNQVVQIEPAQPEVIYVPQYNPTVVYAGYPVAYPGYYYPPYYPGTVAAASIVSFGAGMAVGAWMANGCNWNSGHVDVDVHNNYNRNVDSNRNVNRDSNVNRTANRSGSGNQQWKPDQNRLKNSGSSMSSAQSREARGYGSGQAGNRAGTTQAGGQAGNRAATANTANRASGANAGTRPSTGSGTRTPGAGGAQASTANRSGNLSSTGSRSGSAGAAQTRSAPSRSSSSGGSAYSGGNASSARSSSARGASSRSSSSGGGGASRSGGGGRGGGGRR